MARRGFGGTALRAALGAVGGITEGLQQREILAAQRKQQEEVNALNRFNALRAAGFGASLARPAVPQGERETFALPDAGMPSPSMSPSAMGQALTRATQEDFGVSSRPTGMLDTPIRLALETAPRRMTQAQPSALPRQRITLGGMDLELKSPEEVAQETRLAEQQAAEARARATKADAEEKFTTTVKRLMQSGMPEKDAIAAATLDAKYGDVAITPSVRATMRGQDITAATTRRGQDISAATSMRGQDISAKATGGTPAGEIEKRLPVGARGDIADYNAAIRTLQEAIVEVEKNPKAFGLMPALYSKGGSLGRYARERAEGAQSQAYTKARAQMQSALMKLRKTQFGTQMTRLEKETGEEVFPSGAESPERLSQMLDVLVGNAEQLRRGVYEANNAADLYQPIAPAEKAPPASPAASKTTLTPDQWMDANPQKPGETDAQYKVRYEAAMKGGR